MARLFITLYVGIIGSIALFIFMVEMIAVEMAYDVDTQDTRNTLMGYIEVLSDLRQHAGDEVFLHRMYESAATNEVLVSEVVNHQILSHPALQTLPSPGVLVSENAPEEDMAYFRLAGDDRIFRITDDVNAEIWKKEELVGAVIVWGFLLVVALIVAAWMYFLHTKLKRLELATVKFTEGDFSTRAPENAGARVGGLNKAFNAMAERVEQLIASHKRLTNAVAHEVRTPIFRLRCQLALLEDDCSAKEKGQFIAGMEEDLQELDTMVDELLTYARMERAKEPLQREVQDVSAWLHCQMPVFSRSCRLPVSLSAPADIPISFDAHLIKRALLNLLRNADSYSNSQIALCVALEANRVVIHVDDDGPGIPVAERERILEPFERLDSARTRHTGGYGLGLSIVREITLRHQGEVLISDSPLGGARFSLYLPVSLVKARGEPVSA